MDKTGTDPTLDLVKVNLDTGRGVRVRWRPGLEHDVGWIMDDKAERRRPRRLQREAAASTKSAPTIPTAADRVIYSENTKRPIARHCRLLRTRRRAGRAEHERLRIPGDVRNRRWPTASSPARCETRDDAEIAGVINDENKVVMGVVLFRHVSAATNCSTTSSTAKSRPPIAALPDSAVSLASWSDDWSQDPALRRWRRAAAALHALRPPRPAASRRSPAPAPTSSRRKSARSSPSNTRRATASPFRR